MDENQKLQRTELIQKINTLNQQDDQFIDKYVKVILGGRIYNVQKCRGGDVGWDEPSSLVYLPYSGDDDNTVFRLFLAFIKIEYPEYTIDEQNTKLIFYLIRVTLRKAEKPGLIIWGPVGTGKTTLLLLWFDFRIKVLAYREFNTSYLENYRRESKLSILHYTQTQLISELSKVGHVFFQEGMGKTGMSESGQVMLVDDLGLSTTINHFGSQINILEQLIYARYDIFKQNPEFEFYGTTNLTADEFKSFIGKRAFSRLMEMAEWTTGLLNGKDKRQDIQRLKKWPVLPYFKSQKLSI